MDKLDAKAFYMSERRTKVTPTFMIQLEEELAWVRQDASISGVKGSTEVQQNKDGNGPSV